MDPLAVTVLGRFTRHLLQLITAPASLSQLRAPMREL